MFDLVFPFGFEDFSIWLAISSIILLATSEFLSPYYGETGLVIQKERLRNVALITGFLFLGIVAIKIYQIIITL